MTRRRERKKSKNVVLVLDFSEKFKELLQHHCEKNGLDPEEHEVSFHHGGDRGIIITPNGTYILCHEGVGKEDTIEELGTVEFEMDACKKGSMSIFPNYILRLSADEIKALPRKESIPLHEFIRTFGRRLECNYNEWLRMVG